LNAIVRFDCDGRIIDFDKTAEKLFGFSRCEVVGRGLCATILPVRGADGRDMAKRIEDLCQSPQDHKSIVLEAVKKNGDRMLMHWACCPFIDHNTGKRAVCAVGADLSARDRASDALRESELRLARIIDFLPDPTFVIDRAGVVQTWNRAMTELTGVPAEKIIGKGNYEYSTCFYGKRRPILIDLVLREDLRIEGKYRKLVKRDDSMTAENYITINGTRRYVHGKATRLYDLSGRVTGAIETFADMTDRKRLEEELERHSEQLGKLVEEKTAQLRERERLAAIGETAAMVGHDLRNPLQVLANVFYMSEMEAQRAPKEFQEAAEAMGLRKANDTIRRQIAYMEKIVLDLQDFAREMVPRPIPADLIQIIADSFPLALPPNIKVITDFGAKTVFADDYMIRRAISNLISNAIQAMPLGGTMTIATCKMGDSVAIGVSDTGCGMDARAMANLFKPLCTTKAKGMGMGLVVVKKMVELQGGSGKVESEVGKGTAFTIMLPDKTP